MNHYRSSVTVHEIEPGSVEENKLDEKALVTKLKRQSLELL